jgi:hypothetical protein
MKARTWLISTAALVLALGLCLPLAGCASEPAEETTTTIPESLGMLAPPGLYPLEDGRTEALGVLVHRDLEGGFWALVNSPPDGSGSEPAVIAVLIGADDLGVDLETLEGGFVIAQGTMADGASIFMAGPELVVDAVREATDMVVLPES